MGHHHIVTNSGPRQPSNGAQKHHAEPKEVDVVNGYYDAGLPKFNLLIDWGWFWFFTQPMFKLMDYLNKYFGNFGLAILATTVIVKTLFFPIAYLSHITRIPLILILLLSGVTFAGFDLNDNHELRLARERPATGAMAKLPVQTDQREDHCN